MRIKLLRSLGKNLPDALPDDGDVKSAFEKDAPWTEGQVRNADDKAARYLIRNGLAEETTEDVTDLKAKAKAPVASAAPTADDLDTRTVAELHDIAKKESINLHGATAKDDLVKTIRKERKNA